MTCTNIPDEGIGGVPGSHHPQFIDVLHREHASVETVGVRTAKAMGLRGLPSKARQVNCGWVITANIFSVKSSMLNFWLSFPAV